jgi:DNA-dependent protein kinase catalytic subunit
MNLKLITWLFFCPSLLPLSQLLTIPELMPFRLTRQLLGVLMPHEGVELLVAPMTEALRALRANK